MYIINNIYGVNLSSEIWQGGRKACHLEVMKLKDQKTGTRIKVQGKRFKVKSGKQKTTTDDGHYFIGR
jgi:hypothetical protein